MLRMRWIEALHRGRVPAGRRRTSPLGQTLVEFSLVALLLMVVMMGIMDFARLFFSYASISNAAREGARYGIIYPGHVDAGDKPDPDNIVFRARSKIANLGASTESPFIEVTFPDGCDSVGCRVSVKITAYFRSWTPIIPRIPIVSQTVMYIE